MWWRWLAIAAVLGVAAVSAVMFMHDQEAGDWGDAADHLPSGSTSRLENTTAPEATPEPIDSSADQERRETAKDDGATIASVAPIATTSPPVPSPKPSPALSAPPPPVAAAPVVPPTPPPPTSTPLPASATPPTAAIPPPPPKPATANKLTVDLAWAQEPPEGTLETAAYMVITNDGPANDRLLSASSPDAQQVAVHETRMRDGASETKPVKALEFEAGVPVVFEPGGYQFTLTGLRHPLGPGRKVTIFLIFEKAGTVQVDAPVGEPQHALEPGQTE